MIGDLLTGSLGAVVGGWLLESLGVTDPRGWIAHMAVALIGAMVLLGGLRVLRRAVMMASRQGAVSLMPTVADLEARFGRLGEIERRYSPASSGADRPPAIPIVRSTPNSASASASPITSPSLAEAGRSSDCFSR